MNVMEEREFFRREFEGVDADALWSAVKRALATQDLKDADDSERTARFATGMGVWSWGQNLLVRVEEGVAPTVVVRGRPKSSFLSSNFGETREAKKLEEQFVPDIEVALEEQRAA